MSLFDRVFYPHTVQVQDAKGPTGMGRGRAEPRTLRAEVNDKQQLVRAADGDETISSATVTVALDAGVTVGASVTVWAGTAHERTSTVIAVERDENGSPLPSHLILSLK